MYIFTHVKSHALFHICSNICVVVMDFHFDVQSLVYSASLGYFSHKNTKL